MEGNFEETTSWLLVHEGGYVNHPKDPGGATNRGVIQRTYDGYRDRIGRPRQSVRNITEAEVLDIYRTQYWNAIQGDLLPSGLDYSVYDFAVNSGPARAARNLQALLGVKQDGHIGNITLGALRQRNDIQSLIINLCTNRWKWMQTLSTWSTFGKGWTRRVMGNVVQGYQPDTDTGVIDRSMMLFYGSANIESPTMDAPGKADEFDVSFLAQLITLILQLIGQSRKVS